MSANNPTENKATQEENEQFIPAICAGDVAKVSFLIGRGVMINYLGPLDKMAPLHWAARNESVECLTALIDAGADINITTGQGGTPLHIAAAQGHANITSVLITAGAGINTKDRYGKTPLHWAACNCRPEVCAFLIARGADINAINNYGRSSFEVAPLNFRETLLQIDAFIKASACWNIWEMSETKDENFLQWIPVEVLQDTLPLITTVPESLYSMLVALFNEYPEMFAPKEQEIIPTMPSPSLSQNPNLFHSPNLNPELRAQDLIMAVSQELILQYPDLVSSRMRK